MGSTTLIQVVAGVLFVVILGPAAIKVMAIQ